MQICGLQKTTLLDYPGKVAATVFIAGCNYRCPFCHNMNLVEKENRPPVIEEAEIFSFLKKRAGILDGVCITGGEPLLNAELADFISGIKELGLSVKLDTNGTRPDMLKELAEGGLIDYVAMDIKSSPDSYALVTGVKDPGLDKVKESIAFLMNGRLDYEFRTTVIKEYHNEYCFKRIGEMIRGCQNYYLQSFIDSDHVKDHSLNACSREELLLAVKLLEAYNVKAFIRGTDI